MGKSKLVAGIQEQATKLVERLKQQANQAAPVPHALKVAVVNVIWNMVAGASAMSDFCFAYAAPCGCKILVVDFSSVILRRMNVKVIIRFVVSK